MVQAEPLPTQAHNNLHVRDAPAAATRLFERCCLCAWRVSANCRGQYSNHRLGLFALRRDIRCGDGVGRFLFRLEAHLERFTRSCQRWRLDPGRAPEQITEVLTRCVVLSGLRSSYVEMLCTRGQPPWGSRDPRQALNQFYAFALPYVWLANEQQRQHGLHLRISEVQRIPPTSVDPSAKNYHWNDMTMGLLGALDQGADSAVLVTPQAMWLRGRVSIFFASARASSSRLKSACFRALPGAP